MKQKPLAILTTLLAIVPALLFTLLVQPATALADDTYWPISYVAGEHGQMSGDLFGESRLDGETLQDSDSAEWCLYPDVGYKFDYWYTDVAVQCSTGESLAANTPISREKIKTVVADKAMTFTAHFVAVVDEYTFAYAANAAEQGSVSFTSEQVKKGSTPTGPVLSPASGYEFDYWMADDAVTLTDGSIIYSGEHISNDQLKQVKAESNVHFSAFFKDREGGSDPTTAISNLDLTLTAPTVGQKPDYNPTVISNPTGAAYLNGVMWGVASEDDYTGDIETTHWTVIDANTEFESGNYYALLISAGANDSYYFNTDELTATINGESPKIVDFASDGLYADTFYVFDLTGTAHTHTYNPDVWSSNASQHWHECTDANCTDKAGSIKDVADHTFAWVVDREATATEEGLKHEACTVCGFTRSENTAIAKLDSSKLAPAEGTPKTGDATSVAASAAVLLAGGVVAGAAACLRKMRTAS